MALSCFLQSSINSSSTWGFHEDSSFESLQNSHTALKIANVIGYFLSPVVGLIRIICTIILFWKAHNDDTISDIDGTNGFLWSQLARGAIELVGFGTFLLPVDLYHTHKIRQLEEISSLSF